MNWIKDNGDKIETNDLPATVVYCESIGWKQAKASPKKRTVKKKVKAEE